MSDNIGININKVQLENYKFSGIDASLVGAIKSVADYYQIPLTTSWIYGMTGLSFLNVLDENLVEPNGGPPEPEVFDLVRNIGLEIDGLHVYAESKDFINLQAEAWEKAKQAITSKQPVFAKNIDIGNQTSVIYAYDDVGYYTRTWHSGYENSEDVIPWNSLGLSQCPCIDCENYRKSTNQTVNSESGLISLHWATPIEPVDELTTLKNALGFVIRLNEQGSYMWSEKTYYVGSKAYEKWLNALESEAVDKYFFSLFLEILYEARSHAVKFLTQLKGRITGLNEQMIDEGINIYSEVASRYKILKEMYPYEEPRQSEIKQKEQCITIVKELYQLERYCFKFLKEIHARL
ncbi:hypothetical protein [Paenibacillus sp. R14(2021)]|uniref:hypothetical protein n=1 Tax=Paenibacillus sp. R14(2021) TaxID=2859228 RepID=UPI001C615211|nr:hypothetical protein [Paenibacillus sp. R14(2021)]